MAPLKFLSIPRLVVIAALVAASLPSLVVDELRIKWTLSRSGQI